MWRSAHTNNEINLSSVEINALFKCLIPITQIRKDGILFEWRSYINSAKRRKERNKLYTNTCLYALTYDAHITKLRAKWIPLFSTLSLIQTNQFFNCFFLHTFLDSETIISFFIRFSLFTRYHWSRISCICLNRSFIFSLFPSLSVFTLASRTLNIISSFSFRSIL